MKLYRKRIGLACVAALGLSLSACGGGSSTPTTTSVAPTTLVQLAGVVVDGYMKGATAFVDRNNNGQLDASEPSSITNAAGAFTLTGLQAGDENYPIVVDIPASAVDSDSPNQTVGKHSVMNAPAPGVITQNLVISPITTLIKTVMDNTPNTDKYAAAAKVKKDLKLANPASVNLFADYVAAKKTNNANAGDYAKIHKVAQVVARTVANQVDSVKLAAAASNTAVSLSDVISLITAQVVNQLTVIDNKVTQATKTATWTPAQADTIALNDTVPLDTTASANFTAAVNNQINVTLTVAKQANAKAQKTLSQANLILANLKILQDQYTALVATSTAALANDAYAKAVSAGGTNIQAASAAVAGAATPVITLKGVNPMNIALNTIFKDPGSLVLDDVYTNLRAIVTGTVNTKVAATYILNYDITDPNGYKAVTVSRIVNVVKNIAAKPVLVINQSLPVFSNAPLADVVIQAVASTTPYTLVAPSVTSRFKTTLTSNAPTSFPVGTTIVTWTLRDTTNNLISTATQNVIVQGTVAQANAALKAGKTPTAKAIYASIQAASPNNLEASLGFCRSTFAQVANDPVLRTLLTKFTLDNGATLPTSAQISLQMMGGPKTPAINWAKTSAQLAKTSVNATLLQDPAFDTVIKEVTTCINSFEAIKASNFKAQVITLGATTRTWDRADLNAMLSIFYQVRGGINWARSYNWSTDVNADGIPDTQAVSFVNPVDNYTYQYRTVNVAPVKVLNDPTFFTLAGGGSTLLMSSVNDFYSWANAQVAYLNDMYANPARAVSTSNAFNYGFDRIKLNNDLKANRKIAAAFSASGYLATGQVTKINGITSGVISGQNLTALTRAAFPKFSYDVVPNLALSKQYDNPVIALTGNAWSPTITASILIDRSYDPTIAGVLGTGMTADLFDNIRRPLVSTLLKDSYGKALNINNNGSTHLVTDGTTTVLLKDSWWNNTPISICTVNKTTGTCSALLNIQGVTNSSGASMIQGKLRIGSASSMSTYVVDPATGVILQAIPWTGLNGLLNGTVNFTSDGVNDYVFASNWGQNPNTFNWVYTTTMYQAPVATGNFGLIAAQLFPVSIREPSVSAGVIYGLPAWGFVGNQNQQLIKIDVQTMTKKVTDWPNFSGNLLAPIVVGTKVFDVNSSVMYEYALPANAEFR